jgi:hypothetical protein
MNNLKKQSAFIKCKSLWQWYISTNIMLLDIILRPVLIWKHRPVYFSKHNVSETILSPPSGKTYSIESNR